MGPESGGGGPRERKGRGLKGVGGLTEKGADETEFTSLVFLDHRHFSFAFRLFNNLPPLPYATDYRPFRRRFVLLLHHRQSSSPLEFPSEKPGKIQTPPTS